MFYLKLHFVNSYEGRFDHITVSFLAVLGMGPRASSVLGKCCTTEFRSPAVGFPGA